MTGKTSRPVHVIPIGDEREHSISRWCWCLPDRGVDPDATESDPPVYMHNALDGRDEPERPAGDASVWRIWGCFFED